MHVTEIDRLWFRAHPDRAIRLRRQTPAEQAAWPVPLRAGFTAWCVIRRSDEALEAFGLPDGEAWDDYDEELEPLFDRAADLA